MLAPKRLRGAETISAVTAPQSAGYRSDDPGPENMRAHMLHMISRVRLARRERELLEGDVLAAVNYYTDRSVPMDEAFARIGYDIFGDFYSQPDINEFYPLDCAAKIYPLSMTYSKMSVFRLSANMQDEVVPEILQLALDSAIKRFPVFATILKRGMFWHYLDAVRKRFVIEKENDLPCAPLKLSSRKDQVFRVLYYNHRITFEAFHCVADGAGAMAFFSSILAEYLRLMGNPVEKGKYTFDLSEAPRACETADAYPLIDDAEEATGFGNGKALHISGKRTKWQPAQLLHFVMPSKELARKAKELNTSVTGLVLSAMFAAADKACRDKKRGRLLKIQVPVDMRKYYPAGTLRNFSMYAIIEVDPGQAGDISALIPEVDRQLKEKTAKESVDRMAMRAKNLVNNRFLHYTPLGIKKIIISSIVNRIKEYSFTAVLSNVGMVPVDYGETVKSFEAVAGPSGFGRVCCGLISYKDTAILSITKPTLDNAFEAEIYRIMGSLGIDIIIEGNNP